MLPRINNLFHCAISIESELDAQLEPNAMVARKGRSSDRGRASGFHRNNLNL
jgi:hypothetical protein